MYFYSKSSTDGTRSNIMLIQLELKNAVTVYTLVTGRNEVVAKVIFLHLSVIHSVHRGGLPQCMLGYHPPDQAEPPGADTPQSRHPPRSRAPQTRQTPPGADTPPWEQTPPGPGRHPPGPGRPPHRVADSSIRSMSGRYASYWNAFLYYNNFVSWKKGTSRKEIYVADPEFPRRGGGAPTPDFGAKTNY